MDRVPRVASRMCARLIAASCSIETPRLECASILRVASEVTSYQRLASGGPRQLSKPPHEYLYFTGMSQRFMCRVPPARTPHSMNREPAGKT
eukprot:scaffold52415_cov30-Tisochrysis_lutea.AAC.1